MDAQTDTEPDRAMRRPAEGVAIGRRGAGW
jgi:hypothetical protein